MLNILFVAIEFAPYQTTGAFRSMYFVKYLNRFNINPIVLTVEPEENNSEFNKIKNEELNDIIPSNTVIYRPKLKDYSTSNNKYIQSIQMYFKVIDRYGKFWKQNVLNQLPEIIKKHKPKLIYVSCPPYSAGMLAAEISKLYDLPLVVDMRDGWSKWCITPYASYIHYRLTLALEQKLFKQASKVITVTKQLANVFLETHRFLNATNTLVIPNGYDYEIDFERKICFPGLLNTNKVISISYIGSFYYEPSKRSDMYTPWYKKKGHKMLQYTPVKEDWLYRSPYFFLLTLNKLFEKTPAMRKSIKFTHYGHTPSWLNEMVEELNLGDIFEAKGFYKYEDLKKELNDTDLFLSTSMKVENGEDYAIGSKTFDYISYYKPILGFVTKGAQADFLKQSNTGIIIDPDNIEGAVMILSNILKNGLELNLNSSYLKEFSRVKSTEKLANHFHNLLN